MNVHKKPIPLPCFPPTAKRSARLRNSVIFRHRCSSAMFPSKELAEAA